MQAQEYSGKRTAAGGNDALANHHGAWPHATVKKQENHERGGGRCYELDADNHSYGCRIRRNRSYHICYYWMATISADEAQQSAKKTKHPLPGSASCKPAKLDATGCGNQKFFRVSARYCWGTNNTTKGRASYQSQRGTWTRQYEWPSSEKSIATSEFENAYTGGHHIEANGCQTHHARLWRYSHSHCFRQYLSIVVPKSVFDSSKSSMERRKSENIHHGRHDHDDRQRECCDCLSENKIFVHKTILTFQRKSSNRLPGNRRWSADSRRALRPSFARWEDFRRIRIELWTRNIRRPMSTVRPVSG